MFNLYNTQFDYFGLDISALSLKIVYLKKKKGSYELASFGKKDIPEGVIKGGQIINQEKLSRIIKDAIGEVNGSPLKTKYVVCSLPEEKSFVRVVKMPKMTEKELEEAIKWEAEANIPLPIDKVYLNWEIISSAAQDKKMEVVIAASPSGLVDTYIDTLEMAGLIPVAMELESIAIIKSIIDMKERNRTKMILDIGAVRTSLMIFGRYAPRFTTNLPIFGNTFDEAIKNKLKIKSLKEAEKLKTENGFEKNEKNEKIFNVISAIGLELKSEIEKYITFCQKELGVCEVIEEIILVGGISQLKGISSFFTTKMKRKIILGDPWVNIKMIDIKAKKIPKLSKINSSLYATAIGLAMK